MAALGSGRGRSSSSGVVEIGLRGIGRAGNSVGDEAKLASKVEGTASSLTVMEKPWSFSSAAVGRAGPG